ncbi:MAG: hypothetical protein IPG32_08800 [Saprospirales bacterium]|nr:hypothetical protein [Saprospirales bacterium]
MFIDRLEDYPTWSNALNQSSLLVIPALTGNGDFLTDIPNSVKSLLYSFVSTNGAKLLIMDGGEGPNNNAANILNEVYGYSLVDDCCYNGNLSYLNLENSLYTGFQHGPVAIEQYFQTKIISNLVWPAIPIYELALNGQVEDGWASVARLPKGDGDIIYFGWSFRNGGPLCANADTEFTEVLDRALLHLAEEGIIITQSPEAYSTICGEHGEEFEVVITALDAAGNEGSCTTILTLIDDEFPEIFVPDPLTLDCHDISETQDPSAQIIDWLASAYAIDNCDEEPYLTYDFDLTTLDVCTGGTLTVTWTAVDEAGNTTMESSTIIVVPDTTDPDLYVPAAITLDCGDISETSDPAAIIDAWLAQAYTTDDCDTDPELAHSFNGDLLDICAAADYVITVTWTANDACGNETILSSTITVVVDDVDPDLFVPDPITLDCGDISETSDPAAIIDAWLAEAYTTDNCDTDPELAHSFNGDLLDICADAAYDITVTWTANDACGNTTILSSTITVLVDDVDPFLFVPAPITLDCSDISETSDPAAIIDAWLAEAYTNDNCDTDPELAHSFNGDLLDICAAADYVITVTWTANDACGNETILSSTITVLVDDVDPDLFVPDPITLDCGDISETADPAAIIDAWLAEAYTTDNCDTDPELAHSFNGDLLDICAAADYVITVTWTANDACGNETILSSTITVLVDDVDPDLFVPDPITLDCGDISETADPAAIIDAWLAEAYTTDNCDTDPELAHSFNGDLLDICADADYVITVTWTANDACGNETILSSTITVLVDDVDPFLFVPDPITLDCGDISETSDPAAIIDAWLAEAYTTDNCDTDPELAHSFNGDLLDICADATYVITVTWTANDACGNTTILSSTITVLVDDVDPDLFVPDPITLDCGDISETADPAAIIDAWLAEAYTTDNCDTDPELSHSFNGDLLDICADEDYVITVTWTANDACGNTTVLSSTITVVVDDVDPDLFVPDPITLDCSDISETADPAAIIDAWLAEAYATDNCDTDPELAHSFNGDLLDVCADEDYVITVTWTANDACGNTTVLSSTITVVVDDVDPFLFVPAPIELDCSDISETSDPAAIIDAWLAEAYTNDNCDTDPELAHSFNGDLLDICAAADYVITVTWTANDACGNTTELSSTITVVADGGPGHHVAC